MIAFGHTAVGVGVGLLGYHLFASSHPIIGLGETAALGIASHYLADLVPHGHFFHHNEYKSKVIFAIVFDLFLSIALFGAISFFLYGDSLKFWYILFGIGGAQLPDVLDGFIYIGVLPNKGIVHLEHEFHRSTHWHGIFRKGKLYEGLLIGKKDIWQVATVFTFLFILFKF